MTWLGRITGGRRIAIVIAMAYALVAQGLMAPIAHARAMEASRLDAALQTLCLDETGAGEAGSQQHKPAQSHHQHDCYLGSNRDNLDDVIANVASADFASIWHDVSTTIHWTLARTAAPRSSSIVSSQPRGPPAFI